MARVIITVPEDLLSSVDAQARRAHTSRSALVRFAISEWVAAKERAEFEELLAEGYREMASVLEEFARDFAWDQAQATEATWRWDD